MPPSSRKRNKGKERKAKKLQTVWRAWAIGNDKLCDHGYTVVVPDLGVAHPVCNLIEACWLKEMNIEAILGSYQAHREVWDNISYIVMMVDILTMIGTNMLLKDVDIRWPLGVALTIIGLEQRTFNSYYSATKVRDLYPGMISNRRDALKFFRKRISCSCLKALHLVARKSQPKTGRCIHCNAEKERVLLSVCGRCMISQYCSKECQVAASFQHRRDCNIYFSAQNTEKYK